MITRLVAASALVAATCAAASAPEAERLADRMLAAVGGRAAWAQARNTVNDSRQDWDGEPSELRVVITMDFERPRIRIETRDPALSLAMGREGRLEVHEAGARIAWYALDRAGQPYLYGAHDDEQGAIFGPWEHEQSGIRHPAWVTREGGKWRAMLKRLEVNVPLDASTFAPPRPAG